MVTLRRLSAILTLALSLETALLGNAVTCAMPRGDDVAAMANVDMAGTDMQGMDMTPTQRQPNEERGSDSKPCSFPWSPAGGCHYTEACAPMAVTAPAVTLILAAPMPGAVVPRLLPGPRSLPHTPDPPPPRA